jgi:hypothetical protein
LALVTSRAHPDQEPHLPPRHQRLSLKQQLHPRRLPPKYKKNARKEPKLSNSRSQRNTPKR